MHTHVGTLNVFCLALACLCKVPIKIQSTVDDQYLDHSGSFVTKENQRTRFYAEIVDEDSGNFKFRIMDRRGRTLNVRQKEKQLAWTRSKNRGALWSVRKRPGGDTGFVMTDTSLCLKHSPDKVYLEKCPSSKSTASCPDYIFRVTFKFDKRKLSECRMVLAAERSCRRPEKEKTAADCAKECCRDRMRSSVKAECDACKKTACCKQGPSAVRVVKARKALGSTPCECNGSADGCTKPLAMASIPTGARRPGVCCGCNGTFTNPRVSMLLPNAGNEEELSESGGDGKEKGEAERGGILSRLAGGRRPRENPGRREEEMPGGRQYLILNSQDSSHASGGGLDSAAVKEIRNALSVLNGDKGKSAQSSLEGVKDALMKNLSSETLEAMAKEKKKQEDDAVLKIGMLSKQLAESKGRDGLTRAPLQEKISTAKNVLEKVAADTQETSDKATRTINSAASELGNISSVLGDRDTKKKAESVMSSVGEIASLAKSLAPPPVALATGILSKLGI